MDDRGMFDGTNDYPLFGFVFFWLRGNHTEKRLDALSIGCSGTQSYAGTYQSRLISRG
jgi:hypothetical protein